MMMMANPRRSSYSSSTINNHQISIPPPSDNNSTNSTSNLLLFQSQTLTRMKFFLKKPHAFPFLLSIFLFLAWISLRFHSYSHQQKWTSSIAREEVLDEDGKANLVRFTSSSSSIAKDKRGWLLDPLSVANNAGISGGALTCASLHVGEIRPGSMRGNHRHHTCNETFLIWGAKTKFRLENKAIDKGYAEVIIGAEEVGVIASPSGTAHALLNLDPVRTTFFLGCQDAIISYNHSTSDFNVWKDL
ncbi:hypothetical protein LguiB_016945 [Lonicera macranthoides]